MPLSLDGTGSITGISTVSVSDDLSHVGDANTKISFPANDAISFETAGSERLRIDLTGDVGINETNPTAKLHIVEATSTTAVKIKSGTNSNQNTHITMFNDNDVPLNLGVFGSAASTVGTLSANTAFMTSNSSGGLAINASNASGVIKFGTGSSETERFRIDSSGRLIVGGGSDPAESTIVAKGNSTSATSYSVLDLRRGQAATSDGDVLGYIRFSDTNITSSNNNYGLIFGACDGASSGQGDNPGRLVFSTTADGASGPTEKLRIDSDGRLLIGTTNTSNGHVSASKATVHGHLNIFKDSEGDNAGVNSHQLKFVTQSGSIGEIMATSAGAGGPNGRGGYLSFFAKPNNNATLKETMRVAADYVTIFRENTGNEGGQIGLARSSDNTAYWFIDSYGSSSTPDFRLHAGGYSHFSINSSGQWVDAPTGTIINVGYARHDPNSDSYTTISQDTRASSAVYLDFTPRRSDSKLIIMTRMHTRMIAANGCSYGIEQSTNSGGSYSDIDGMAQRNAMDFFYKGDGVNHHYTGFCMRQIDSYTGSRRFRPWGQGWSGGTWEISYGHGEHSVTIYEVAV